MSKGDWTRPVDKKKFDKNFENAFGKRGIKTWNPEEESSPDQSQPQGDETTAPSLNPATGDDEESASVEPTSGGTTT